MWHTSTRGIAEAAIQYPVGRRDQQQVHRRTPSRALEL